MLKKYLPFIILLLIAIPVALFYVFFRNVNQTEERNISFEAVPESAILLFENRSAADFLDAFHSSRRIGQALKITDELSPLITGLGKLDTLIHQQGEILKSFKGLPFFISVHQTGEEKFDLFMAARSLGRVGAADFENIMRDLQYPVSRVSERSYIRTKIIRYSVGEKKSDLFIAELKDYLLASRSEILVEESIRQIREGISLKDQPDFEKVLLSAGQNVNGNVYVNLESFPSFAGNVLSARAARLADEMNYGSWLELDLTFRPDAILLNGFASPGDTVSWLEVMKSQEARKIEVDKVLPANCMSFFALGFNDNEKFQEDLASYLVNTGSYREHTADRQKLDGITGQDVVSRFMNFAGGEVAMAYLPGVEDVEAVVVIGTQSKNMALEVLTSWISGAAGREGKTLNDYRHAYRIDQERLYTIYNMPVLKLPGTVFGPMFGEVSGKYFGFAGNYLLMADSRQAIQDIIYFNELNKTLSTDQSYQNTLESIVSRSNFFFYSAPFRSESYYSKKFNSKWSKWFSENEEFLRKMGAVSLQIQNQPKAGLYFHNLIIRFSDNSPDRPETVWESRLETTLNFKPALVRNHTTGAREIIVQDEANKLYLVNSSGRILWNLPMEEAIRSEIFQIDYFKNGRLQYLFSTDNSLHLIDREGNYVDNYPVSLRAKATNGMALFDYDNNRNYRIFIACADQKVYLYDKKGNLVKGWDFDKTEGMVNHPVIFQRIENRDYIIFSDEMRVYILDRRGDIRVNPEKQFARSANNSLLFEGARSGHQARLITTDVEGTVYYLYFDGKVESKSIRKFDPDHYFEIQDLDQDGSSDFIFLEDDRLEVYNASGSEIFIKKMDDKVTHPPAIYRFPGNDKKIGVVTRGREEIYLYNSDGSLYEGFPLRGRTMFSIGYLSGASKDFNLLVGGDNLFLYNYRVK